MKAFNVLLAVAIFLYLPPTAASDVVKPITYQRAQGTAKILNQASKMESLLKLLYFSVSHREYENIVKLLKKNRVKLENKFGNVSARKNKVFVGNQPVISFLTNEKIIIGKANYPSPQRGQIDSFLESVIKKGRAANASDFKLKDFFTPRANAEMLTLTALLSGALAISIYVGKPGWDSEGVRLRKNLILSNCAIDEKKIVPPSDAKRLIGEALLVLKSRDARMPFLVGGAWLRRTVEKIWPGAQLECEENPVSGKIETEDLPVAQ